MSWERQEVKIAKSDKVYERKAKGKEVNKRVLRVKISVREEKEVGR